jgi:hypothetical protein
MKDFLSLQILQAVAEWCGTTILFCKEYEVLTNYSIHKEDEGNIPGRQEW